MTETLIKTTDETLMQMYQDGDAQAFDALYSRHSGRVLGYLMARLRNPARAEEVLQGVFFKLHRARHQYRPTEPFGPWFFTLIQTALIDAQRAEARNPARPGFDSPEEMLHALASPQDSAEGSGAETLLGRLEAPHRKVLELRYVQDLSFEAIAARLGISAASARQRVSRAIRKLRGMAKRSPS